MKDLRILLIFFCIGVILYWIPNHGVPLNSDVTWLYRIQISRDESLREVLPAGWRNIGAYPSELFPALIDWYELTGRFNIFDIAALRIHAGLFGSNADLWRLSYVFFLSFAVGLFFLCCRMLLIPVTVSLILSIGLFFSPTDVWIDQKSAEPRAIFFLMAALFFQLKKSPKYYRLLSSVSMLLSVLTKETFIFSYPLLIGYSAWANRERLVLDKQKSFLLLIEDLKYHIGIGFLLIFFILGIKLALHNTTQGYVFTSSNRLEESLYDYISNIAISITPSLFEGVMIYFFVLLALFILASSGARKVGNILLSSYTKAGFPYTLLILALGFSLVLSIAPYFLTGRSLVGRYIIPTNYIFPMLIGVVLTPIYTKLVIENTRKHLILLTAFLVVFTLAPMKGAFFLFTNLIVVLFFIPIGIFTYKTKKAFYPVTLFIFLVTVLLLPRLDLLIHNNLENRLYQTNWQNLVNLMVDDIPKNSHVTITLREAIASEYAYSLEANTLFRGRLDLAYTLKLDKDSKTSEDNFVNYIFDNFSLNSQELLSRNIQKRYYIEIYKNEKPAERIKSAFPESILMEFKDRYVIPNADMNYRLYFDNEIQ